MVRPLVIGPEEKARIEALKERAAARVRDAKADLEAAPEAVRQSNFEVATIALPVGFQVTYTHERQPVGLCQHLSVSVDKRGKTPHPAAVDMILEAFGMKPLNLGAFGRQVRPRHSAVWLEEFEPGMTAVNVVQTFAAEKENRTE